MLAQVGGSIDEAEAAINRKVSFKTGKEKERGAGCRLVSIGSTEAGKNSRLGFGKSYAGVGTTCNANVIKRDHKWYVPAVIVHEG